MSRSRFVQPDTTVLPISNGDTLTVRNRLTAGERRAIVRRSYMDFGGVLVLDPSMHALATVVGYLLDWSLRDASGKLVAIADQPVDAVQAAVEALDEDDYAEVKVAIERHEDRMEAARATEKNEKDGERTLPVTSPSPVGVAGTTTGSLN